MTVIFDNGTHRIESAGSPAIDERDTFKLYNGVVMQGGSAVYAVGNTYYPAVVVDMAYSTEIVNDANDVQAQIDQTSLGYPPVLKVPVLKYAGGDSGQAVDEVYFNAIITDGVLSVTGQIPSSGNWKIELSRINDALLAINADWKLIGQNVTFIV